MLPSNDQPPSKTITNRRRTNADDAPELVHTPTKHEPPAALLAHSDGRLPSRKWFYQTPEGLLAGAVLRYEGRGDGERAKEIRQLAPFTVRGAIQWLAKGMPAPRPLYGLPTLRVRPDAPVLIVEGEKACTAAQAMLPGYIVTTWPGGAAAATKADWSLLQGRSVIIWPDHDDPGRKAADEIRDLLAGIASSVRIVDLGRVQAALMKTPPHLGGGKLAKGWDLADIPESWTPDDVVPLLEAVDPAPASASPFTPQPPTPHPAPEPQAAPKGDKSAPAGEEDKPRPPSRGERQADDFLAVDDAVKQFLRKKGITANATGTWCQRDDLGILRDIIDPNLSPESIVLEAWHCLNSDGFKIDLGKVGDLIRLNQNIAKNLRYEAVKSRILGKPATEAGKLAVVAFCRAINPDATPEDVAAVMQWMWQVKRRLAGMTTEQELMLVIYGPVQGSGKTTAVRRLLSHLHEFQLPITANVFRDERERTVIRDYAVGFIDELSGLDRAACSEVKELITADDVSYRILGRNGRHHARRLMNFIGTSNRPVSEIIRDTTGARRFWQLEVPPDRKKIDWEALNAIPSADLWEAVSENDPAPILPHLERVRVAQEVLTHQDSVAEWLRDERWLECTYMANGQNIIIQAYNPATGELCQMTRYRYLRWCQMNMERYPATDKRVGSALASVGVQRKRRRGEGDILEWHYMVPETLSGPRPPKNEENSFE